MATQLTIDGQCMHGDPYCPCQDGDPCNYETYVLDGGRISVGAPCRNGNCHKKDCESGWHDFGTYTVDGRRCKVQKKDGMTRTILL